MATETWEAEQSTAFLADTAEPVRGHLAASVELREFLRDAGDLSLAERRLIVGQALLLLDQNYVHLPLKVAMHAVNPVQRLRLLQARLARQSASTMEPEWVFHAEMSEIFHSVRDLHTNYVLPAPFVDKIAYLPFQIEECFEDGERRYIVSRLVEGFSAPGLGPGVRVGDWDGIPIDRAVALNAARFAGSNAAARHARGLESLTIRPLKIHRPPDEEWVALTYLGIDGTVHELRQKWLVTDKLPTFVPDPDEVSEAAASLGLDLVVDEIGRAKKLLFAPEVVAQEQAYVEPALTTAPAAEGEDVPTAMPGVFRARSVTTPSGTFGHIRIFTFHVDKAGPFVAEFVRLLGLVPQEGLILDVRGNGGGHLHASEFTLQTLTPRRIQPEPVQFINSPLNLRVCRKHKDNVAGIDLGPWFPSMEQATETGATFSQAFPMTPEEGANVIGQVYQGPVVLVTDARCYSATDFFAAGFQDHEIGPVLGVDENTGAGGANVWTHGLLWNLLETPTSEADSPYRLLPKQANLRVAIRRSLRVGKQAGTPLEDLGVVPDVRHQMTRKDVLEGNVDLLAKAGQLLAAMPVHRLDVTASPAAGALNLELAVTNVDRCDVYVDGRPRASVDPAGGAASVSIPDVSNAHELRVEGFSAGKLVAAKVVGLA
jgi:hypothetical protein